MRGVWFYPLVSSITFTFTCEEVPNNSEDEWPSLMCVAGAYLQIELTVLMGGGQSASS